MDEARKRVLELLAEGKISVDDAVQLLDAIEGGRAQAASGAAGSNEKQQRAPTWDFDIEALGQRIQEVLVRAFERVERELRDLDKRLRREDWPRHSKMGGHSGGMAGYWAGWGQARQTDVEDGSTRAEPT